MKGFRAEMRMTRAAAAAIAVLALAACRLPTVPDESIESLEGTHVAVVSQQVEPNPTRQWNYTYIVLEVTGPEPRVETVASVLRESGWSVHDSRVLLLTADFAEENSDKPAADLGLVELDDFLEVNRSIEVQERFSSIPVHEGRTYYVAILTPLGS
jgi:hypothetical protein